MTTRPTGSQLGRSEQSSEGKPLAMWDFRKITDIWEYRSRAIVSGAEKLGAATSEQREQALQDLTELVRLFVDSVDDSTLAKVAVTMVDDLYKSIFAGFFRWDEDAYDYLDCSAAAYIAELRSRGLAIHYLVDNSIDDERFDAALLIIDGVFSAAGLMVTGPQLAAFKAMEHSGREPGRAAIPAFIEDGQAIADGIVERCQAEHRSYMFLNMSIAGGPTDDTSFAVAQSGGATPGVIRVIRSQAPEEGSTIAVVFPESAARLR